MGYHDSMLEPEYLLKVCAKKDDRIAELEAERDEMKQKCRAWDKVWLVAHHEFPGTIAQESNDKAEQAFLKKMWEGAAREEEPKRG